MAGVIKLIEVKLSMLHQVHHDTRHVAVSDLPHANLAKGGTDDPLIVKIEAILMQAIPDGRICIANEVTGIIHAFPGKDPREHAGLVDNDNVAISPYREMIGGPVQEGTDSLLRGIKRTHPDTFTQFMG
jgi:hypothetical protein